MGLIGHKIIATNQYSDGHKKPSTRALKKQNLMSARREEVEQAYKALLHQLEFERVVSPQQLLQNTLSGEWRKTIQWDQITLLGHVMTTDCVLAMRIPESFGGHDFDSFKSTISQLFQKVAAQLRSGVKGGEMIGPCKGISIEMQLPDFIKIHV